MYRLLLLCLSIFILSGCSLFDNKDKKSSDKFIEIQNTFQMKGKNKDGSQDKEVSENIKIPKNPKNVVVFDYATVDTLKELGVSKDVIKALPKGEGSALLPDFLSEFKDDKFLNTGELKGVNYDVVAKAKPDVIFISGRTATQKDIDEFKKIAPDAPIVYVGTDNSYKHDIDKMKKNTKLLGKIFDKEVEADKLIKKYDNKVEEFKKEVSPSNKTALFLLVNEGELSTFGKGGRFGSFIFDQLGYKTADDNVKESPHGQNITNEYIHEKNPDVIFTMDRGQALQNKSTSKQALNNNVIKNVNAIKDDKVYELDPKLWYFSTGSVSTSTKQIDNIIKLIKEK